MELPENIKVKVLTGRFGSIEEYQEFIELRKEFFQEARRTPRRFFATKNPIKLQNVFSEEKAEINSYIYINYITIDEKSFLY